MFVELENQLVQAEVAGKEAAVVGEDAVGKAQFAFQAVQAVFQKAEEKGVQATTNIVEAQQAVQVWQPAARARLEGLRAPGFNGLTCTLLAALEDDRWQVEVDRAGQHFVREQFLAKIEEAPALQQGAEQVFHQKVQVDVAGQRVRAQF